MALDLLDFISCFSYFLPEWFISLHLVLWQLVKFYYIMCVKGLFWAYEYPPPFAIKNISDFII